MRLIDADALKKDWHMANKCEECPQDARKCQYEQNFTRMDICEMLDEAPTVGGWISVKDRLPKATEPDVNGKIAFSKMVLIYLVYDNGFTYQTVDTCRVDKGIWMHEVPGEGCRVTHWMPLPEPPKDGEV